MKTKLIVCPYCQFVHEDSIDYIDPGDMEGEFPMDCEGCNKPLKIEFDTVVSFHTSKADVETMEFERGEENESSNR